MSHRVRSSVVSKRLKQRVVETVAYWGNELTHSQPLRIRKVLCDSLDSELKCCRVNLVQLYSPPTEGGDLR